MEANEELKAVLEREMDDWARQFIEQQRGQVQKKGMVGRGDLAASFGYDLEDVTEENAVRVLIAFNEYGRMQEMRRINHDKWGRNAVTRVEDWIVAKGVQKFVHGFLQKYKIRSAPRDLVNRIAWGIMVARSGGKFRRNPWYNRPKSAAITDLYNKAAVALTEKTGEVLTRQFDPIAYAKAKGRR